MITIGIDVGLTGAIAAIDEGFVDVRDLPVTTHGGAKWIDGTDLLVILRELRGVRAARVIVEHVHAMPKMGTIAANSKGMSMGSILATVQIAGLPLELVPPQTWKRALGLIFPKEYSDRQRKEASLSRARLLFPTAPLARGKDHGRAEALLIAHWAARRAATGEKAA